MSSSSEEEKIYDVISKALLALCEVKPNDPVDFLSRKMLELIGEPPSSRLKTSIRVDRPANENVVIKMEKIAIENLQKDFYENYKIIEEISVHNFLVEDLNLGDSNGQKCVRIISKSQNKISLSDRMITTLINLSHPNLVRIIEILEDDKNFYVIHDYCPGKDLFTYFYNNREKLNELLIKKVLTQVLSALSYLHRSGVIYKNICFSKVLVCNSEFDPNDIQIKLGDLITNTETFSKKSFIYKGYGNVVQEPLFIAPEFVEKKYNNKVDIWSAGILAYLLFIGKEPFTGTKHEIIYQIANKKIEYPPTLSNVKKSLLKKMLNKNPNERYEADDLLKEEYFHDGDVEPGSEEAKDDKEFLNVVNSMCTFTKGKNLRKSVMSYIVARKLYKENDIQIRKKFEALDHDKKGYIDKKELLAQYKKYFSGTTEKQIKIIDKFMESADTDNNGKIDYAEFLTMMNLKNKELGENALKEVFDYYDKNKNGFIEASDIREIFEDTGLSNKEVHQLIDDVDINQDRKLGFEEFYKIITAAF
jgi:calcium-dependent protein kinase